MLNRFPGRPGRQYDLTRLGPTFARPRIFRLAASLSEQRSNIGLDVGNSPQFAGVNLGNASDTLLSRLSAGVLAVAGSEVPLVSSGTWTPALQFGGLSTGITYSTQVGHYIKIGKICLAAGRLVLTSKGTATGNATIAGLPFTGATLSGEPVGQGVMGAGSNFSGLTSPIVYQIIQNTATIQLNETNTTQIPSITDANVTASTVMNVTLLYYTA